MHTTGTDKNGTSAYRIFNVCWSEFEENSTCPYFTGVVPRGTRVNVNQSVRLFTFCVLNQSECVKLSIITTKGVKKQHPLLRLPCHSLFNILLQNQKIMIERAFFFDFLGGGGAFFNFDVERYISMLN